MTMTMVFLTSSLLLLIMTILIKLITNNKEKMIQKWNTFECGFLAQSPSSPSFSIQFFLIMILFLIFDIEVSLLFPFTLSTNNSLTKYTMTLFILMLMIGLLAEWKYKKIHWSK